MTELIPILLPIALIDSTSVTPLGIVPLTGMLAGRRPYTTATAFLAGLSLSYTVMGLAFVMGLSSVFLRLNSWLEFRWHHPEPADFILELVLGLVLVFAGSRLADRRRVRQQDKAVRPGGGPLAAFGLAVMVNVVGFPGALPFFAAADQILRADPPTADIVLLVVFYSVIFILPLSIMVLLRRLLGDRGTVFMTRVKDFFDHGGRRLLMVLLVVLGALMAADAALYFLRGTPLAPIGWPG